MLILFEYFWYVYLLKFLLILIILAILIGSYVSIKEDVLRYFGIDNYSEAGKRIKIFLMVLSSTILLGCSYWILKDSEEFRQQKLEKLKYEQMTDEEKLEYNNAIKEREKIEIEKDRKAREENRYNYYKEKYAEYFESGDETVLISENDIDIQRTIVKIAENYNYKLANISMGKKRKETMIFEKIVENK